MSLHMHRSPSPFSPHTSLLAHRTFSHIDGDAPPADHSIAPQRAVLSAKARRPGTAGKRPWMTLRFTCLRGTTTSSLGSTQRRRAKRLPSTASIGRGSASRAWLTAAELHICHGVECSSPAGPLCCATPHRGTLCTTATTATSSSSWLPFCSSFSRCSRHQPVRKASHRLMNLGGVWALAHCRLWCACRRRCMCPCSRLSLMFPAAVVPLSRHVTGSVELLCLVFLVWDFSQRIISAGPHFIRHWGHLLRVCVRT